MNMANMPNPKRRAARFVVQTARMRIIFMSTSGDAERFSETTQSASRTMVATPRQRTEVLPHPHVGA